MQAIEIYLKDVLGINSVMLPAEAQQQVSIRFENSSLNSEATLGFLSVQKNAASLFAPEVFDLFSKMRKAMKLSDTDTTVCEISVSNKEIQEQLTEQVKNSCETWVAFSPEAQALLQSLNKKVFLTLHPQDLLKSPELKKQAWDDLKQVMLELGL